MEFVAFKKLGSIVVFLASCFFLLPSFGGGAVWKNLDKEHRLGGRMVSDGYLRGKVVLVNRWGCDSAACCELLPQLEEIWDSFKSKPFVLLGGHCKGCGDVEKAKSLVEEKRLTYPVYEDAGLAANEPALPAVPHFYLVDETGEVRYRGKDERLATERLVMLLTDMEAPKNVQMWERFLDYELKALPGRGFIRLAEFRKKFPNDAKKYDEDYKRLKNDEEVQKLVKLVAFAKLAKDFDPKNKATKGKVTKSRIDTAIKTFDALKDSKDEAVAQEAKNALADLTWAKVNF